MRKLAFAMVLLVAVRPAGAQDRPVPRTDPAIRLTLRPAAAPVPALKYHLLPQLIEQSPGNAAVLYYRGFSPELQSFRRPDAYKLLEGWNENPRQRPGKELEWGLAPAVLKEVDLAARREYCDWEITPRLRKEGISLTLPDLQGLRDFARLLALRARLEVEKKQFEKAVFTFQTGYAFARHVAEFHILITALIGMASATEMTVQVEEFIQTPGSPNLYWAFTDLPVPLIDFRRSYQGERILIEAMLPGFREALTDLRSGPLAAWQLEKVQNELPGILYETPSVGTPGNPRLDFVLAVAAMYPDARRFLLFQGRPAELVEKLPMLQVVLLAELATLERLWDDIQKWTNLPFAQVREGVHRVERQVADARPPSRTRFSLAGSLLPAIARVEQARARIDRRMAALRCIEALRLSAAAHDGRWPHTLEEITEVPVPPDPYTGKPFGFRREGDRATLSGSAAPGTSPAPQDELRYELTLAK
jgi:hypothetical protein